jgi:short subunit dehydrogenase-like uncharacterized protein
LITIYGASGYTGRLIAEQLAARGADFTIAGRNGARLGELRAELLRVARGAEPRVAEVVLEDRASLVRLLEHTKVLLTCAGPYAVMGKPLVDACLEAGVHYLDITGEARFMIDTHKRDAEAKARGIALVNAVGADVVPSDFVAHLATEMLGGEADSVDLGMVSEHPRASGGTLRSLVGILGEPGLAYRDGAYVEETIAESTRLFEWPVDPKDERASTRYDDLKALSAPLADLATLPRTTGAKNARTYLLMHPAAGAGAKLLTPLARPLVKTWLGRRIEKSIPSSGSGPSPDERRRTKFAFIAEAQKGTKRCVASIRGRDAYGLTVQTSVHAILAMCNPAYARTGAMSPMQAIEPGIWRALLEKIGCKIASARIEDAR